MDTSAFHLSCPDDVVRFVEAGFQLDESSDVLAVFGRFDQRANDRAVSAGAVERLLDRQDARIIGRLLNELHHGIERVERVVQQDVVVGDLGE